MWLRFAGIEQALEAFAKVYFVDELVMSSLLSGTGLTNGWMHTVRNWLGGRRVEPFLLSLEQGRRTVVSSLLDLVLIMPTEKKGRVPFDAARVKPIWWY